MRAFHHTVAGLIAGLCGTLVSTSAHAEIKILKASQSPVPASSVSVTFNGSTGGWDIVILSLYAPGGDSIYEIHGNAGEIIDNIFIAPDGPPAGSPLTIKVFSDAPGGITNVNNILQIGTAETILAKVTVNQDVGSIQCEVIGDITAGRDVLGPFTSTTTDNPVRGIGAVKAGRHILGDMVAEHGRVVQLMAQTGNIGTVMDPITVRSKYHTYHVKGDAVYADINTRADNGTGNGGFWALVANKFFGSLNTTQFFLNGSNNVDGLIEVYQQFQANVTIGKSFVSPTQYIQVPLNGLNGQVIVNADNVVGGAWTSPIRIGANGDPNQVVLTGPNYSYPQAVIGSGGAGLVPFKLFDQMCAPANGASVAVSGSNPSIALCHRGPVTFSGAVPLTIDRRAAGSNGAFAAAPLSDFAASIDPLNHAVLKVTAAPGKPGFAPGWQYRIKPASTLRCDVPAQPAVVWDADYLVTVIPQVQCVGDVNSSGAVDVDDLFAVINAWGTTGGPANIIAPAIVDIDDLFAVINHWGICN